MITPNINLSDLRPENRHSHWRPVRLVITVVALGALTYGICNMMQVDWSKAGHLFRGRMAAWKMATIVGASTVTVVALGAIFHRAIYETDSAQNKLGHIPDRALGKFWGDAHWIKINGWELDISTLDENNSGTCYAYYAKGCGQAEYISTVTAVVGPPLYPVAIAVYQLTIGWILRACRNQTNPVVELSRSVWRTIQSPFYTLAYTLAQLAVFVDPLNGRKLVANIERDWNRGVVVQNGCASAWGWHTFKEGMGMKLGSEKNSAFYLQGCYQPTKIYTFEGGVCTNIQEVNGFARPEEAPDGE